MRKPLCPTSVALDPLDSGFVLVSSPPPGRWRVVASSPNIADVTTVLLVEDDPAISEPLARAFGREGYEVLTHGTGKGALERSRLLTSSSWTWGCRTLTVWTWPVRCVPRA